MAFARSSHPPHFQLKSDLDGAVAFAEAIRKSTKRRNVSTSGIPPRSIRDRVAIEIPVILHIFRRPYPRSDLTPRNNSATNASRSSASLRVIAVVRVIGGSPSFVPSLPLTVPPTPNLQAAVRSLGHRLYRSESRTGAHLGTLGHAVYRRGVFFRNIGLSR